MCCCPAGPSRARERASQTTDCGVLAREPVDLVIQDMNFRKEATSGEEGVALFRSIREQYPSLPIMLMTAWTHLETAVDLVKAGAADYIAKPWDDARLLTTVRNLLELRRLTEENERAARKRAESRAALAAKFDLCGLVFESEAMRDLVTKATHIAPSDVPVLITGPERFGQGSARCDHPGEFGRARRSVRQSERRRAAEGTDGGGAVRRRSRCVHRRR